MQLRQWSEREERKYLREPGREIGWGDYLLVEGLRFCQTALQTGRRPEACLMTEAFFRRVQAGDLDFSWEKLDCPCYLLGEKSFKRHCDTKQPQGLALIFAKAQLPEARDLRQILRRPGPLRLLALEEVQDPGNMGSIIRSAYVLGYDALLYSQGSAQPWKQKVLRAAMGAALSLPLLPYREGRELLEALDQAGVLSLATSPRGRELEAYLLEQGRPERFCLFIGNEARGLDEDLLRAAGACLALPVHGCVDSFNAAAAAAIFAYRLAPFRD